MARAKKAKSENDVLRSMFPDLPTRDDVEDATVETKGNDDKEDYSKVIQELQAKLAEQERSLEESRRERMALMSQPQRVVPPQEPKFDTSNIPNPIDDPEGYAKAVRQSIDAGIKYQRELDNFNAQQERQQTGKLSSLWESFQEAHPDYAENQKRVEIAATQVVQRAQQRGINLDQYMYANSGMFMKDVIKEMDDLFGKPTAGDDTEVDDDDEPDNRTGGIPGGAEAGGRGSAGPKNEKLGSLTQEISQWQAKTGYGR